MLQNRIIVLSPRPCPIAPCARCRAGTDKDSVGEIAFRIEEIGDKEKAIKSKAVPVTQHKEAV